MMQSLCSSCLGGILGGLGHKGLIWPELLQNNNQYRGYRNAGDQGNDPANQRANGEEHEDTAVRGA